MSNYTVSPSVGIMQKMFNPFRLDDSKEDLSMLVSSIDGVGTDSSSESVKYFMNNMLLPIIFLSLWFTSLAIVCLNGRFCCCLRRVLFRIAEDPTIPLSEEEEQDQYEKGLGKNFDLVTIASDDEECIMGRTTDQVKYEVLCAQMRRIRNFFSCAVAVTVVLSIPTMLSSLYLKDSYTVILRETDQMSYRLNAAGAAINEIYEEREILVEINANITASLESASLQNCFEEEILVNATEGFSSSLQSLSDQIKSTNLQKIREIYEHGEEFSNSTKRGLHLISCAIWVFNLSILLLNLASVAMLIGSSIAKRNSFKRWHQTLFQRIFFPILVFASMLLILTFSSLVLIGIISVDFCASQGNPTNSLLKILSAKIHRNTAFYEAAEKIMLNECINESAGSSMYDAFRNGVISAGKIEAFVPNNIEESCSEYNQLSSLLAKFTAVIYSILPSAQLSSYVLNCEHANNWYTDLALRHTCSNAPKYLPLSLLLLFILLLLSVAMIATNIILRTDIQLFKEIYSTAQDNQIRALNEVESCEENITLDESRTSGRTNGLRIEPKGLLISDDYSNSSISYDQSDHDVMNEKDQTKMIHRNDEVSSVLADAMELTQLEMVETAERMRALSHHNSLNHRSEINGTGHKMIHNSGELPPQECADQKFPQMNIYGQPGLIAKDYSHNMFPVQSHILTQPSANIPPTLQNLNQASYQIGIQTPQLQPHILVGYTGQSFVNPITEQKEHKQSPIKSRKGDSSNDSSSSDESDSDSSEENRRSRSRRKKSRRKDRRGRKKRDDDIVYGKKPGKSRKKRSSRHKSRRKKK